MERSSGFPSWSASGGEISVFFIGHQNTGFSCVNNWRRMKEVLQIFCGKLRNSWNEIFLTLCLLIAFWGPAGEYLAQTNQSLEFEVARVYNCPCKSSKYAFHSTSPASQTISEAAHKSVSVGNTVISKHLPQIIKNCLHSSLMSLIVSLMQFWPSSFVNSCCVLQNLSSCIVSMYSLWPTVWVY